MHVCICTTEILRCMFAYVHQKLSDACLHMYIRNSPMHVCICTSEILRCMFAYVQQKFSDACLHMYNRNSLKHVCICTTEILRCNVCICTSEILRCMFAYVHQKFSDAWYGDGNSTTAEEVSSFQGLFRNSNWLVWKGIPPPKIRSDTHGWITG